MSSEDKRKILAEHGLLNRAANAVTDSLFVENEFFDAKDIVQVRYEMLRSVRTGARTAKAAAAAFGVSRATLYETLNSFEKTGIGGLVPLKRGPRGAHKLTDEIVDFIDAMLAEDPQCGWKQLASAVEEQFQISVHPRSVERAWKRRKKNLVRPQ
jgi:transposase